jgi:hypothetical protein
MKPSGLASPALDPTPSRCPYRSVQVLSISQSSYFVDCIAEAEKKWRIQAAQGVGACQGSNLRDRRGTRRGARLQIRPTYGDRGGAQVIDVQGRPRRHGPARFLLT